MSDIAPIGRPAAASATRLGRPTQSTPTVDQTPSRGGDKAEFSQKAQLLSRLAKLPDVRQDLVDRVKAEIAKGTYETPEKLDGAINGLLDDLRD
ncbi:MAG: flagellar biosynthesis anti-sigma factor FlgM [Planctomycetota bacterium]|nr:flagellar biosynthesis anti-sigma factor FlgM [Planctomycetota bacterium]